MQYVCVYYNILITFTKVMLYRHIELREALIIFIPLIKCIDPSCVLGTGYAVVSRYRPLEAYCLNEES